MSLRSPAAALSCIWVLALGGCGDARGRAALERELAEKARAHLESQAEIIALRRLADEMRTSLRRERDESESRVTLSEARRNLAEQRAEDLETQLATAHLAAEVSSAAFLRAAHIQKELLEAKDEPAERARLLRSFWKGEIASVERLRTVEDMIAICRAIGEHRFETGRYPPSGNKNLLDSLSSNRKFGNGPYFRPRPEAVGAGGELLDPWGRPYVYLENRTRDLPEIFPNRRTYLLYSLGPNGKDETAPDYAPGGDDVCNW